MQFITFGLIHIHFHELQYGAAVDKLVEDNMAGFVAAGGICFP
jgi:hypothetical protein